MMASALKTFLEKRVQENNDIISEIEQFKSSNRSQLEPILLQFQQNNLAIASFITTQSLNSRMTSDALHKSVELDHAAIDLEDILSQTFPFNQNYCASEYL